MAEQAVMTTLLPFIAGGVPPFAPDRTAGANRYSSGAH
jgi:hypothetical protein